MKQEISLPLLIGAVVAILLIIAFVGWQVFSPHDSSGSAEQLKAAKIRKAKREGD